MLKKWILAIAVLAVLVPAVQAQDELQVLKDKVEAQEKSIAQMKEQIKAVEQKNDSAGGDNWWNRINWSGDFRYRHEMTDDDSSNGTRNRQRARARIKMNAKVNEEVDFSIRLATGDKSKTTSANQTFESQFDKKDVYIDQMYLTYSPTALAGFQVLAGKMANPFVTIGGNQIIWDSDVTLEGGAFVKTLHLGEATELGVTGGYFWMNGDWSNSEQEQYLAAIQGHIITQSLDDISSFTVGVSYYDFGGVQGQGVYTGVGNSEVGSVLHNDYNLLELFAELNTKIQEVPFAVYGSYIDNGGTESGYTDNTAWVAGAKLNKAKDPGSWQLGYEYREVEKDAVLGYFTESDFLGSTTGLGASSGGVGSSGHKIGLKYQAMKNVQLAATYYMAKQKTSTVDYDLNSLLLDVVVKFK